MTKQWSKAELRILHEALWDAGPEGLKVNRIGYPRAYDGSGYEGTDVEYFVTRIFSEHSFPDPSHHLCIAVLRTDFSSRDHDIPFYAAGLETYYLVYPADSDWYSAHKLRFPDESVLDVLDAIYTDLEKGALRIFFDMD
jgi:hypothetical protein